MADESIPTKPPLVSENGEPLGSEAAFEDHAAQIEALRAELESLRQSVTSMTVSAKSVVGMGANVAIDDVEEILKRNVFASVGIAAFFGYLWGKIR